MLKVLIVDDEPDIAANVTAYFRRGGWDATSALNGKEALELLDDSFDAVVLDLRMPGMDGETVFNEIRKRPQLDRLCIVVLTAYGKIEGAVKMIRQGAYQYLQKPFQSEDLMRILISGIAWQRAHSLRHTILGSFDQDLMMQQIRSVIAEAIQPEGLYIILLDAEGRVMGGDPADVARTCDVNKRFLRHLRESQRPLFVPEGACEWDPITPGARCLLAAPIPGVGGKIAGVIDIEGRVKEAFDGNWVDVLSYIADLAGISLALMRQAATLVHDLSHRISTPLQVVKLQVETLISKELNSELPEPVSARIMERLRAIERNVKAIAQVLDDLRDIFWDTRIRRTRFDLFTLLDACHHDFESELGEKRIELKVLGRLPEGLIIEADSDLLRYSFQCLLQNAIDAIENRRKREAMQATGDGITITVKCPDPERVLVIVQDTGIGIAPENRERLFEPLFTTRTQQERAGMGLFSVRRVVTMHGGSIVEESKPGEGARFVITLPTK
ncbi:MAG: response regulator [Terriglobia bacterium]|jgi:signal transduction histidine kinase